MSNQRWQQKYLNSNRPGAPAEVLLQNQHLLPAKGKALDLACGLGANTLFLAGRGLNCQAWDFSSVALEKLDACAQEQQLSIQTKEIDLEREPFPDQHFDLIVVAHYLHRPLCDAICRGLNPGGLLFYQTFCQQKTSDQGPSNPRFLLAENELLALFQSLQPVVYREERLIGTISEGFRNQAMLIGRKPFLPGQDPIEVKPT